MKPAAFEYVAPVELGEACEQLALYGEDAAVLAGGQSLLPLLNRRIARPVALVDIGRIPSLRYVREDRDCLAVGAATTQRELELHPALDRLPALRTVLRHVGHVVTRNRGTVCGSVALAAPGAQIPLALLTLGGTIVAVSSAGRRELRASEFFRGPFTTTLGAGEIISEVRFPLGSGSEGVAVEQAGSHQYPDIAVLAIAHTEGNACVAVSVGVAGAAPTPVVMSELAEEVFVGRVPNEASLDEAVARCVSALAPTGDLHGSAPYKRRVARVLLRRALGRALTLVPKEIA